MATVTIPGDFQASDTGQHYKLTNKLPLLRVQNSNSTTRPWVTGSFRDRAEDCAENAFADVGGTQSSIGLRTWEQNGKL